MNPPVESPLAERELTIVRETHISPDKLFAGWTIPKLMEEWFCPKPWYVKDIELDLRAGGGSKMTICGPNGEAFPNEGVYLEVVPNQRLVFTDAYTAGWVPNPNKMFTGIITFEALPNGGTRYIATARHWTKEDCEKHEAMGFTTGWGQAFDQLVELCDKM